MTVKNKTHRLTLMAMFAALAYIFMTVGRFPISSVEFLKYDPKDIMLVICGFVLGPVPALLVTAVVVLVRCLHRGHLYIYGGAFLALGLFMPLLEFLVELTFAVEPPVFWSLYPMAALVLLGSMLIFLAICRPARESMERKFFL